MIAGQLSLKGATTLLDLGGGPGTYAMAFLAKHPGLRATVCDRPDALEVAREIAATHKTGARLSYLPLDFLKEDIPGPFDVIWYSNVLHIYSPEQNQAVFRRAKAALAPGGRLIIQDAFLHDREGLFPEEASLFAVSMLLFTETGNTYSLARNQRLAERGGVWFNQATEDEEGDGGLGGWDSGGCNPCKALQKARPPNTIRSKFKVPLIPLSASIVSVPPFPPRMLITVARSNANPTVP